MSASREKYGSIVNLNLSPWMDVYLLSKPEAIKYVLIDNQKNYQKAFVYRFLKQVLGNGLVTSEGDFWLRQRRIAQPAFHRERLASLATGMVDSINKVLYKLEVAKRKGEVIDMAAELMRLTTDIASRSLFNTTIGAVADKITDYVGVVNQFTKENISSVFQVPLWIPTQKNYLFKQTLKKLDEIIYQFIASRRNSLDPPHDLLTM